MSNTQPQSNNQPPVFGDAVSLSLIKDPGGNPLNGRHLLKIGILTNDNTLEQPDAVLTVQVDSGSCGLVIPAQFLYQSGYQPNPADVNDLPKGILRDGVTTQGKLATVTYQPSQDDLQGFYYTISRLALGVTSTDEPETILENIDVIGIVGNGIVCKNPQMIGVGFSQPVLANNPFLYNVTNPQGQPLYPSYYIDSEQIVLGMQPPADAHYQTLESNATDTRQTQPMSGVLTITQPDGSTMVMPDVSILLDTGLDLMMVVGVAQFPLPVPNTGSANNVADIEPAHITVGIQVSDTDLQYTFPLYSTAQAQLGISNTATVFTTPNSSTLAQNPKLLDLQNQPLVSTPAPTLVHVIAHPKAPNPGNFINTGFNALFANGMFFDNANRRVAFFKQN